MTIQKVKEEAKNRIIKDTRRVYIRTEDNPDGELITNEEFDDFIDSIIIKAYEEGIDLILDNIQKKLKKEKEQTTYNRNMYIQSILGELEDEILEIKNNLTK